MTVSSPLPNIDFGVYGLLDVGYRYSDRNVDNAVSGRWGMDAGMQSTSRVGLKVKTEIAEGFNLGGILERSLKTDTGADGNGWNRQALVFIQNEKYGKIALGRQLTPSYLLAAKYDFFALNTDAGMDAVYKYVYRVDNMVSYQSPNWRGLSVLAGYSFNISGDEKTGNDGDISMAFISPTYKNGAFDLALNYHYYKYKESASSTLADGADVSKLDAFAMYDFKYFQLSAGYGFSKASDYDFVLYDSEGKDTQQFMAGIKIPVYKEWSLVSAYTWRETDVYNSSEKAKSSEIAAGIMYDPTEYLKIYLVYSNIINNSHTKNSMLSGGSLGSSVNSGTGGYQRGFMAGVSFSFDLNLSLRKE
ncbi:putative porin [Elusimicrobium posterum]